MVAFDLRGMGESDKPRCAYDFDELADDLAAVIAAADLRDVVLVGWSMGTTVSLRYLDRGGTGVSGLVMVNGPVRLTQTPDFAHAMSEAQLRGHLTRLLHSWPGGEREFQAQTLLDPAPAVVDWLYGIALQTPLDVALTLVEQQSKLDMRGALERLQIPVLAAYSRHDPYYPVSLAQYIAELAPAGRHVIFDRSRHCIPIEEPDRFCAVVEEFARRLRPRTATASQHDSDAVELGHVKLAHGQLSYAAAGRGRPVVLLHQTPRSCDEYRDVLPALAARGYRAIAFDTPGFGASAPLPGEATIERWAQAIDAALDVLSIEQATVVGHHTGGVIAVELAARRPERIHALALSSTPLTDDAYRNAPRDESDVDNAHDAEGLRRSRADFYPGARDDLLDRYVGDALRAGSLARLGHEVVAAYRMDDKLERLRMPVLLIGADCDPFAFGELERLRAVLPHAETAIVEGGMVPLPDGWPEQFAGHLAAFLDRTAPQG